MSYKTILVQGGLDELSNDRILLAARIGRMFEGAILGVGVERVDPPSTPAYNAAMYQSLLDDARGRLDEAERGFLQLCKEQCVDGTWIGMMDSPARAISSEARAADLIVATRIDPDEPRQPVSPDDLIMESGLPVLVGPEDSEIELGAQHVVVAWKDTRECRRAIWDALPFLKRTKVTFLVHVVEGGDRQQAEKAMRSVALRLKRQGVLVEIEALEPSLAPISEALTDAAGRHGADLVVVGAYGHSRLREWVFGGVTQDFINYSSKFVLFCR